MKRSISTGQSQAQMRLSEYRAWHQQAHHLTRIFSFLRVLTYFSAITVFSSCHRIWTLKEVCNLLIPCPKHKNMSSYFEFEIFNHSSTQKGLVDLPKRALWWGEASHQPNSGLATELSTWVRKLDPSEQRKGCGPGKSTQLVPMTAGQH